MPDLRSLPRTLIRGHPEDLENTGFRVKPGMTIKSKGLLT
jgi:hypothetical protein